MCVTDTEMMAPMAAETMATVTIELLNPRRMTIAPCCRTGPYVQLELSRQRIGVLTGIRKSERKSAASGRAFRGRVGTALFGERALLLARAQKQRRHPVVALVTPRLLVDPVFLVALLGVFLLDGPGSGPRRWIFDRDGVL